MSLKFRELLVYGNASGKLYRTLQIDAIDLEKSLMDFLIENNIPIASSCAGVGQCLKCVNDHQVVTCQITLSNYILHNGNAIAFDYL